MFPIIWYLSTSKTFCKVKKMGFTFFSTIVRLIDLFYVSLENREIFAVKSHTKQFFLFWISKYIFAQQMLWRFSEKYLEVESGIGIFTRYVNQFFLRVTLRLHWVKGNFCLTVSIPIPSYVEFTCNSNMYCRLLIWSCRASRCDYFSILFTSKFYNDDFVL